MGTLIGETLSHFEILEFIGKGGFGEVYRARDTELDRHVAIKVLPEAVSADSGRPGAVPPRSARRLAPEPPQHLHHL